MKSAVTMCVESQLCVSGTETQTLSSPARALARYSDTYTTRGMECSYYMIVHAVLASIPGFQRQTGIEANAVYIGSQ